MRRNLPCTVRSLADSCMVICCWAVLHADSVCRSTWGASHLWLLQVTGEAWDGRPQLKLKIVNLMASTLCCAMPCSAVLCCAELCCDLFTVNAPPWDAAAEAPLKLAA